jgi:hypothetical protein
LDCDFPDAEFYQLFQKAAYKKNVYTIPYTAFESFYAEQKNVIFNHEVIRPIGITHEYNMSSIIPIHVNKSETLYIPPYLNDASMNLAQECRNVGLTIYNGRYNGPQDLKEFKGIIHIPYAWSNVAFFENIHNGLAYFIPSSNFIINNFNIGKIWWPTGNYFKENYHLSEWYNSENTTIITYFDSWQDLKNKIESTDFDVLHAKIKNYAQEHHFKTINQWKKIFTQILSTIN